MQDMPEKPNEEADRGDDESRLAVYGLAPSDVLDDPLVIGPCKHVRLSGYGDKMDHRGLVRLKPKSLDDVKRWIGVPDEVGAKRACGCEMPSAIRGGGSPAEFRKLDVAMRRTMYDLAYEYVHGDSRRVAAYKPHLNVIVNRAVITGVFFRQDIDIYNGAVLEVGADIKILFARHIRIWVGGLLRITGDAKIDCVSITGEVTGKFVAFDYALPAFARVINVEVARD